MKEYWFFTPNNFKNIDKVNRKFDKALRVSFKVHDFR